jgi:hypothetical protein
LFFEVFKNYHQIEFCYDLKMMFLNIKNTTMKKCLLILLLVYNSLWAQPPHTFYANGSLIVPAGITSVTVEAWGGGGAGGGASGSGLTEGRGAAGGGGGAYAKAIITVATGSTLNAVVAPQTPGTVLTGGTGGASTITGFESSIYAIGGSGGGGNTAGGTPQGGAGGTIAGSFGTTKNPGTAGANGSTTFLSVLFSSGIGGAGATPGGGIGGGAVGPVILGSGPGNAGVAPGGGGGGAMSSALSAGQIGGAGAAGQVIVSYTCPTYNITGTSALNACATSGTSTVTVTGPAVNLPVGTYTVTFNVSSPSGTALTSTLTVATAGTGTFPVTGLTTVGTSTITITKIQSGACSNTISAGNTATITVSGPTVGGSISAGPTICSGSTSGVLNLSGQTGNVIKWQSSTDSFGTFTDIPNTNTTYTSGPLTATTQFRAVVQNGTCSVVNSNVSTVTVNPLPSVVIGTVPSVCSSSTTTVLNYSNPTGTPTTYSIVWSSVPSNSFVAVTDVALSSNQITIAIPAGTAVGSYTGTLTVKNTNGCVTSPGLNFNVNILALPAPPTIGTIMAPTCAVPTGSIPLSGLPPGGTLVMYPGAITQPYSGTTATISGLTANNYTFTVSNGSCTSLISGNALVSGLVTNTYTSSWSGGTPNLNQNLVFAGNFTSAGGGSGNINGCSCTINSGFNVLIKSGDTMTLINALVNNGSLTFENSGSLIQIANVANTGSITYKRNTSPVRQRDFTYWSAPVSNFTLYNLSPTTEYRMYRKYDPTTGWVTIPNGAATMTPGVGYIVRAPETNSMTVGSVYAASFVGVPNNGDVPLTPVAALWNLVGNPYPSALDAIKFIQANTVGPNPTIVGTLYFWTHNTPPAFNDPAQPNKYFYTTDDYAVYNLSGTVATSEAISDNSPANNAPTGNIAAGQAFFLKALTTNPIIFNNSMRVVGADNSQFFKTTNSNAVKDRLWLNFKNDKGAFKQLLVGYFDDATNTWDNNFDATTFSVNPYVDFYSVNETKKLTIQGRAVPFEDTDQVPIGYKTTIVGEFSISLDHVEGLFNQQDIYLEDKTMGIIHDLAASNYTFSTEIGTFTDRFVLRYTNKTLGTGNFENIAEGILVSVKNKAISIVSSKENIKQVTIFDITGKTLYNKKKVSNTELQIQNVPSSNQVLLVKVTLDNDFTTTRKIIFQ